jgi:hypothetical protein
MTSRKKKRRNEFFVQLFCQIFFDEAMGAGSGDDSSLWSKLTSDENVELLKIVGKVSVFVVVVASLSYYLNKENK